MLCLSPSFKVSVNPAEYDFVQKIKARIIDPYVVINCRTGETRRVSALEPELIKLFEERKRVSETGYHLKIHGFNNNEIKS